MKRGFGLKTQLHLIIGAISVAAMLATGAVLYQAVHVFYKEYVLEEKGKAIAQALSGPAAKCLVDGRWSELNGYLAAFPSGHVDRFDVDVRYAFVLGGDGRLYASSGASSPALEKDELAKRVLDAPFRRAVLSREVRGKNGLRGAAMDFAVPLVSGSRRVGVLRFGLVLDRARLLFWRTTLGLVLSVVIVMAVVWMALYRALRGRILLSILRLSDAVSRVRDGDLTTRLKVERLDELGIVAQSFNLLVERLKSQKLMQVQISEAKSLMSSHESLAQAHRELAEAHEKLQEAQDQIIKSEKHASLGRLVRGVAHEINNPLNTVKNSLGPLKRAFASIRELAHQALPEGAVITLSEAQLEDIQDIEAGCAIIERGVARAVAIVRDLRSFSSLGPQALKPVDLGSIIDAAVLACEEELGADGRVRVDVSIDPVVGQITLDGHENLLVQLFVNLITNAAQAISSEGHISIWATRRLDRIHIEVEDDGPGIPEEVRNKVFEPFFTTKEAGKGSGLGLALCLGIVEKHDGSISVESEAGKGTTVMIELAQSVTVVPDRAQNKSGSGEL